MGAVVCPPPPQSRGTAEPLGRLRGPSIQVIKIRGRRGERANRKRASAEDFGRFTQIA